MEGFPLRRLDWSWVWTQLETFVLLRQNADIDLVREKLRCIPRKRADETIRLAMGMSYVEYIRSGKKWELFLQPIQPLHLPEQRVIGTFPDTGNIKILYSLIAAGFFIVILSCIDGSLIVALDMLWFLTSVAIIVLQPLDISTLGYFLIAAVAAWVALGPLTIELDSALWDEPILTANYEIQRMFHSKNGDDQFFASFAPLREICCKVMHQPQNTRSSAEGP